MIEYSIDLIGKGINAHEIENGERNMFCINCGSNLPEGARFCMACGTKVVSVDVGVAPVNSLLNPKTTGEHLMEFSLCGQTISFDGSFRKYTELRKKFMAKVLAPYGAEVKDLKNIFKEESDKGKCVSALLQFGESTISRALDQAIEFLIGNEVYGVSKQDLAEKCAPLVCSFDKEYAELEEKYVSIIASDEQMREYRELRHAQRGRWQGGGFGLGGAIKGAAVAGALNFGGTIISGIGKSISAALDHSQTEREKQKLLNSKNWIGNCTVALLHFDIPGIFECAYSILCQEKQQERPRVNHEQSKVYMENANRIADIKQYISVALRGIHEDPYSIFNYIEVARRIGWFNYELFNICEFFVPQGFFSPTAGTLHGEFIGELKNMPHSTKDDRDRVNAYVRASLMQITKNHKKSKILECYANEYLEAITHLYEDLVEQRDRMIADSTSTQE